MTVNKSLLPLSFCRQAWHMHELHYIYSQTSQFPRTSGCSNMMAWHRRHGSRNLCISRARLHTASSSVPDRHRSMRWAANMNVCRTGVKVPHVTVLLQLWMTVCLNQTTSNVFNDKPRNIFTCICTKCTKCSHEREIISFCLSAHIFHVRYSWKDPENCWYWKSTLKTAEKI